MASLVAACQLDTALRAARAVISCEAELDAELRLRKVSAKLADLFQASAAQLEGTAFLELLEEDDHERFKAGLKLASDLAQQHGEPTSSNVNVSKRSGPHKDLELCVCSLPRRQGTRYLLALAEVRDGDPVDHPEEGLEGLGEPSAHLVAPRLTAQALATHSWATPAIPNCSSVWEVKVLLDEQSLEVHGLHIALNTNHWKRSRKTFLKECILPGVWDNFKRWIDHTLQGRPGPAPFIVPFALHRIMSGIACARNVELKRKVGSTGRNELSLRLRHIFVRRPVAACHKAGSERSRDTL
ncbi:unnamed protein product [Effrenium voratum]|uniref:Uncharacterized protein n=1 Tax=Effrenium voratum TaxID=2562239 RepID=A0AA36MS42_9DINO|nr:unnamed protein product [Effrenium voratum]